MSEPAPAGGLPAAPAASPVRPVQLDVLLECLVALARLHDQPATRDALSAGLPLEEGRLTPSLFGRAASRAGLASRIVKRDLERLPDALLPAVLLLADDEACVLVGWNERRDVARVILPELGELAVELPGAELARRYIGTAIFSRPRHRFDRRTPEVGDIPQRHWFWGTMAESWRVYRDVLLAAFLINVFALALPLFTMNVYDRVVPNRAVETLWLLAVGLMAVLVVDFALRMMRGYFIDSGQQPRRRAAVVDDHGARSGPADWRRDPCRWGPSRRTCARSRPFATSSPPRQ